MRTSTTQEGATGVWLLGGVRRAGRGTGARVGRGVCPRAPIGALWPPVSPPSPPKSRWSNPGKMKVGVLNRLAYHFHMKKFKLIWVRSQLAISSRLCFCCFLLSSFSCPHAVSRIPLWQASAIFPLDSFLLADSTSDTWSGSWSLDFLLLFEQPSTNNSNKNCHTITTMKLGVLPSC